MFINRFALYQNLQKRKIENCIGLLTFITKLDIGSLFSLFLVSANQNKDVKAMSDARDERGRGKAP